MKVIHTTVVVALAISWSPSEAAAQAPAWVHELADELAASVEEHADRLAQFIEQRVAAQQAERQGRGPRGPEFTEPFSKTVRLDRNGTFDLQNVSGEVVITGGGGNDMRLEATKRVRHQNESEARALLSEIQIRVLERSGGIEVRTDYPRRRNWSGRVDFSVTLPRDANVTLRSVSGSLRVTNLNGELRAESVSGNIVTSATKRIRMTKTVSGDVEIAEAEGDELTAGSISGRIAIRGLKARAVDAQTVSGNLRLTDVDADRALMRSVSGAIEYAGRLSRSGRYQFQSHSGEVRITPADVRGFTLDATTFRGNVVSDYPMTLQGAPSNGGPPRPRTRAIRGSFGDGGAALSAQSFSGDIVIAKR